MNVWNATGLIAEFRPMLRLAVPLAVAELGWMIAGIVDTIMAGPFGAAAVGAGSLGGMLFYPIAICATGMLLGMDTLVAQAFGAGNERDCRHTLINALWMAAAMTPMVLLLLLATIPLLRVAGANLHVLAQFAPYMRALLPGVLPLLLFTAFRRYLQAINIVTPITFALISSNLVNVAGNWLLMYRFDMGLEGSGWSTSISRIYMAVVLGIVVLRHERQSGNLLRGMSKRWDGSRIRELIRLGLPAAGQMVFEGTIFSVVTVMAARLDEAVLAAHSIGVQVIATTYMVPLGISSAAAIRVGQAIGRKDPHAARAAGWTAMILGAVFMGAASLIVWTIPGRIMRGIIPDPAVIAAGAVLLRFAAFFQLFDGLQVTATGALRGLGDTHSPMLAHLIGYWAIGLPLAYLLCFPYGWGVPGIWFALCASVMPIGTALGLAFRRRERSMILHSGRAGAAME
jgi:MATE family multidrug resistance protein